MNERRFYVYVHIVAIDFSLDSRNYSKGDIVYVGSGTGNRYKHRSSRNFEHRSSWDNLLKLIITDNLTEGAARKLEQETLDKYTMSNHLFNKNKKCGSTKRKYLSYQQLDEFFNIDPLSPSYLSWKVDRTNGRNNFLVRAGQSAGCSNSAGYFITTLEKSSYFVHRIVWALHHKQDCPPEFTIDHKDGNPKNNDPSNLQKVTHRDNSCNQKKNSRNKSSKTGVYLKNIKGHMFWTATWQDISGNKKRKYFGVNKFGNDLAFKLACEIRDSAIKELINQGINYTERHING